MSVDILQEEDQMILLLQDRALHQAAALHQVVTGKII
jgi:hypothetical protein